MSVTNLFTGRAEDYTVSRPGYALELIQYIDSNYGGLNGSVVADIGSGTGKFAKFLLDRGSEVYGVEPNDEMRAIAERELGGFEKFHAIAGTAEHTTLADHVADHITTAQAFHWFDTMKFKQECKRVLKDNGTVFLIWNSRTETDPLNQELYRIFAKYCPAFHGFSNGMKQDDPRIRDFFDGSYEFVAFDHPLHYNREKFIARCLSSSYSLKENNPEFETYSEALNRFFDTVSENGVVTIANRSVAYIGKVR